MSVEIEIEPIECPGCGKEPINRFKGVYNDVQRWEVGCATCRHHAYGPTLKKATIGWNATAEDVHVKRAEAALPAGEPTILNCPGCGKVPVQSTGDYAGKTVTKLTCATCGQYAHGATPRLAVAAWNDNVEDQNQDQKLDQGSTLRCPGCDYVPALFEGVVHGVCPECAQYWVKDGTWHKLDIAVTPLRAMPTLVDTQQRAIEDRLARLEKLESQREERLPSPSYNELQAELQQVVAQRDAIIAKLRECDAEAWHRGWNDTGWPRLWFASMARILNVKLDAAKAYKPKAPDPEEADHPVKVAHDTPALVELRTKHQQLAAVHKAILFELSRMESMLGARSREYDKLRAERDHWREAALFVIRNQGAKAPAIEGAKGPEGTKAIEGQEDT